MAKIVDEYSISLGPSEEFPTVLLTFKTDDGDTHGPFELVPPYAHTLSDELCVAAARAAKKMTGGESRRTVTRDPSDGA
jgi:hypothetical protein